MKATGGASLPHYPSPRRFHGSSPHFPLHSSHLRCPCRLRRDARAACHADALDHLVQWAAPAILIGHIQPVRPDPRDDGVTIQVYVAILASLLISLWVGRKPTIRSLEMLQFYFTGWATEAELMAHLDQLKPHTP